MAKQKQSIHEVDFCGQIASAINSLVDENRSAFPFREARVEGLGKGPASLKRKDLRLMNYDSNVMLCGEVKLPGTPEGRSAFDNDLMQDAFHKAENEGVQYFFTWNVNEFVLFDRGLWERPLIERRVRVWRLQRTLANSEDVAREDSLNFIKTHFLPDLLRDLTDILPGRQRQWLPPDEIFIRSLESHLDWPVQLATSYILQHADKNKAFNQRVEEWLTKQDWTFVRTPYEEWFKAVENMAKTLAYVWANRLIFYKALRARFPDLPGLTLRASVKKPADAVEALNRIFQRAVDRSGDYESLLMPDAKDWATELMFHPDKSLDAWRSFLHGIESVDFREVSSDVVGRIFQKLIGPEERHRYGQHFTRDDPVDLINTFCIRKASDAVLDPACGSGSFLVRGYYRKHHLDPSRPHVELIGELFGCDIALYPAHLATLNLAAREINDEANYPRISRRNFLDFVPEQPFCTIPRDGNLQAPVFLPLLDAIVGNPPYVRQEKIEKPDKVRFGNLVTKAWPNLRLTGRSNLHCYFWPLATKFLRPDGYFGFLTESTWLDADYGFALQGWVLSHFRILAIMESAAEPWFEDARVKTCITILQRCEDPKARAENRVRFVRFTRTLAEIIGFLPGQDEEARQAALEGIRNRILSADDDCHDNNFRIIVKKQADLWEDGVRAGLILGNAAAADASEDADDEDESDGAEDAPAPAVSVASTSMYGDDLQQYRAGKWGRYVRAPDIYFGVMRRFATRFVALGEIAQIRFGVKTGCDAFFMPTDITQTLLESHKSDRAFREHAGGASRQEAHSGKLRIIRAGHGSVHPIEQRFLAPEVHSLMNVDRPVIHEADVDRVVLLIDEPLERLKKDAPWAWQYIRYGVTAPFSSTKAKGKPVPERATCKARDRWYDLTGLVNPGFAFWPKSQQYRHIIPANPERVICNCNLYDISSRQLIERDQQALVAVMNSTLVALFKTFYGRFAGTEGNLKTEVVDVNLLEIPDPRGVSAALAKRLAHALKSMTNREMGRLVEEQLMDCHTPDRARKIAAGKTVWSDELRQPDRRELDDAVFELLGVADEKERATLIDRLYDATAKHFRDIRVVEIEKMQQRTNSGNRRFNVHDMAADIWDAAELEDATPLAEWIGKRPESNAKVEIPEDRPANLSTDIMFAPNSVFFGKSKPTFMDCQSRGQAELVTRLANAGVSGKVKTPADLHESIKLLARVEERLEKAHARFQELAECRTGEERIQAQLVEVLERWFVVGRDSSKVNAPPNGEAETDPE